jgi:hypothetical protein
MMGQPVQPTKLDSHESHETSFAPFGCMDVQMDRGLIHFHDAAGMTTGLALRPEAPRVVTILLYEPPEAGERRGFGFLHQLDAEGARNMAASLTRLADEIDGGRGKQ